jgi:hypothetical protein
MSSIILHYIVGLVHYLCSIEWCECIIRPVNSSVFIHTHMHTYIIHIHPQYGETEWRVCYVWYVHYICMVCALYNGFYATI